LYYQKKENLIVAEKIATTFVTAGVFSLGRLLNASYTNSVDLPQIFENNLCPFCIAHRSCPPFVRWLKRFQWLPTDDWDLWSSALEWGINFWGMLFSELLFQSS